MSSGDHDAGEDPGGGGQASVTLLSEAITAAALTRLRHAVTAAGGSAGLTGDALEDFVLAVHELVTNVIRHGGGAGELLLRQDGDVLTCRVTDRGPGLDDVVVRLPTPEEAGHRGLWLAQRLSGALVIDHSPGGVTASVTARIKPPRPTAQGR
ncbi:ATP-binding protein [Micromonospora sp. ATA51]|uniref:ATP-binding protein n=1 Tax=Micromonospora sp. ATA51 TaxID=2806098 RepID=UPI001A3D8017|nr:ATP-binding protein [Micromonospora sp. ATA51]MBM0225513.1 ATP-binding protein [Micromonospora sp. ATA51]